MHAYFYFVVFVDNSSDSVIVLTELFRVYVGATMLYGTEGGGRGQKSKYTVLPRGGRVQFDF